jgi:hypothetical protein
MAGWLAPHCGGGTGVTVPGLGAVGSGGRGVPGSVEKRKINKLRQKEGGIQTQDPHTNRTGQGMLGG